MPVKASRRAPDGLSGRVRGNGGVGVIEGVRVDSVNEFGENVICYRVFRGLHNANLMLTRKLNTSPPPTLVIESMNEVKILGLDRPHGIVAFADHDSVHRAVANRASERRGHRLGEEFAGVHATTSHSREPSRRTMTPPPSVLPIRSPMLTVLSRRPKTIRGTTPPGVTWLTTSPRYLFARSSIFVAVTRSIIALPPKGG
nr:MAG TPA: hypothetical protein [Caudoviricetes sp.]